MPNNNNDNVKYMIISVFSQLFAKCKSNKVLIICVCVFMIIALAIVLSSCSSAQKITVKQDQGNQCQETVIESETKIQSLTL